MINNVIANIITVILAREGTYRSVFALINMGKERIVPVVPELSSCNHLSVVRGHHVYKEFWVPVVANGKCLSTNAKTKN